MLRPRIIPCLLVHNKGLVKTVQFENPKYVGDPLNAVKIFNEKEADELMVIDIDASVEGNEPDYQLIKNIAAECRMPLCYGGGVKNVEQAQKIINLGAEKVALSSSLVDDIELVTKIGRVIGNQSVVAVIDIKKKGLFKKQEVHIHNATKSTGLNPVDFAVELANKGVGEIVINSVDQDGVMEGYDYTLIEKIKSQVNIPVTALGGASSLDDIEELIRKFGVIGAAAGSLFVFKGVYKAVLINYPNPEQKLELIKNAFGSIVEKN
ncbi:AglZ/HisF2 family acetamidino modification protein [Gracilimonas halophila]|uniref:imidazole glycerol-phosphate synthase n=1 Tax=Gracilimonas halophila TaxID=1834464 RepID=A0ABW5JLL3_9BACT